MVELADSLTNINSVMCIAQALHGLESSEIKVLLNEQSLRSHIPRRDPQGVTGHPIIFNAYTQSMKGDAQ